MFVIEPFLKIKKVFYGEDSDSLPGNCLINSNYFDNRLYKEEYIKHMNDIQKIEIAPENIDLSKMDYSLIRELFGELVEEIGECDEYVETIIEKINIGLEKFKTNDDNYLKQLSSYLVSMGDYLEKNENLDLSVKSLILSIKLNPDDYIHYYKLGLIFKNKYNNKLLALYYFKKSYDLCGENLTLLKEILICHFLLKDIENGLKYLNLVLSKSYDSLDEFIKIMEDMTNSDLLKIAIILIQYNKDREDIKIPSNNEEVRELFKSYESFIEHFSFRNIGYENEKIIREIANLYLNCDYDKCEKLLFSLDNAIVDTYGYRGLLCEKREEYQSALNLYENFLINGKNSPIKFLIEEKFIKLASKLSNSNIKLIPPVSGKSFLIVEKNNLWDSIVSIDNQKILENKEYIESGFHELRINFLSEIIILEEFFQEGYSYKLILKEVNEKYEASIIKTVAYMRNLEIKNETLSHWIDEKNYSKKILKYQRRSIDKQK